MLSQLAVRAARPEAIRQKCAEERPLRRGLAQGRFEAIPKGSAARVKPPIHEAGFRPHRGVQRRRVRGGCAETRSRAFRNERMVP